MPDPARSRKSISWLWIVALFVLAGLAVFAAVRLQSWHRHSEDRRLLTLTNPWNPVSETGYVYRPADTGEGVQADHACADALRRMLQDCRAAGCKPQVTDGYRSVDDQLVLYDEAVQERVDAGLSPE